MMLRSSQSIPPTMAVAWICTPDVLNRAPRPAMTKSSQWASDLGVASALQKQVAARATDNAYLGQLLRSRPSTSGLSASFHATDSVFADRPALGMFAVDEGKRTQRPPPIAPGHAARVKTCGEGRDPPMACITVARDDQKLGARPLPPQAGRIGAPQSGSRRRRVWREAVSNTRRHCAARPPEA